MKKFTKYLFVGITLLFCLSATAQYSDDTFMVSFAPGTTQQEIDQARSDFNSIELDITPITNVRLWKVQFFPHPYPPTGEMIIDINDTTEKGRSRSSINGGGLNYLSGDVIGAPVSAVLKDPQLDCKGLLSTYLPADHYPVSVGVFDTGLNYFNDPNIPNYHFDLGGFNQWDHLNNDPIADDTNGHGSHMASVVSHTINKSFGLGESSTAPLESYEIRKAFDVGGSGYMFEILDGLEHAALSGMNVASCSWSFKTTLKTALESPLYTTLSKLESDYNILVVAAAGNDGVDLNQQGAEKYFPAGYDLPNILTATTYDCQGGLAPFANYGFEDVDIALPGIGLAGLESDNLVYRSGTSQSTALLAGIAASLGTHLENFEYGPIICAIMNSAESKPNLLGKVKSGGVIDAESALEMLADCADIIIPRENGSQMAESEKAATTIFPNPAKDQLNINYQSLKEETLFATVIDIQGRILKTKVFDVNAGENSIYWSLEGIPTGFYHLTIRNSVEMETYKIIIEK